MEILHHHIPPDGNLYHRIQPRDVRSVLGPVFVAAIRLPQCSKPLPFWSVSVCVGLIRDFPLKRRFRLPRNPCPHRAFVQATRLSQCFAIEPCWSVLRDFPLKAFQLSASSICRGKTSLRSAVLRVCTIPDSYYALAFIGISR